MPSNAGGKSSVPGRWEKIPHDSWPKKQNIKQKQYCNKFDKDFQKMVHIKKKKSLKRKQKFALIHSSDLNTALRKSFYSKCYARFIFLWEESFVSFIFDDIKQVK